jgi:hypothetical protein
MGESIFWRRNRGYSWTKAWLLSLALLSTGCVVLHRSEYPRDWTPLTPRTRERCLDLSGVYENVGSDSQNWTDRKQGIHADIHLVVVKSTDRPTLESADGPRHSETVELEQAAEAVEITVRADNAVVSRGRFLFGRDYTCKTPWMNFDGVSRGERQRDELPVLSWGRESAHLSKAPDGWLVFRPSGKSIGMMVIPPPIPFLIPFFDREINLYRFQTL